MAALLLALTAWLFLSPLLSARLSLGTLAVILQLALLAAALGIILIRGGRWSEFLAWRRLRLADALTTVLLTAALTLLLAEVSVPLMEGLKRIGLDETDDLEKIAEWVRDVPAPVALFVIAVLPAVCEETLFRGVVLQGFRGSFGSARALIYASLLFGAVHLAIPRVLMTTTLGLYFGAIVLKTRSLWAGVLAHAVNNAVALALPEREAFRLEWALGALTVVVLVGTGWFTGQGSRNGPKR
ncbi:MAG: CPBP family intramembrane metalloprotease [Planctomycetes bacterium]|nr:CPBP family intramembrane metalloprotease [Planctomycetota bacterium]